MKDAKAVMEAEVVVMAVVLAKMAKRATQTLKTPHKPNWVSRMQTTPQTCNRPLMPTTRRHATKTVNPARSAHVTATAANVPPVAIAVNAKSGQTCAFHCRLLDSPLRLCKSMRLHRKQHQLLHLLQPL